MKDDSRLFRWVLLLTSLLTIGFLVAAALRENFLAQWYQVQGEYRQHLLARATDERGRELLRNFRRELKQVSVPALGAVDRCVSCHNGIDDPRMTDVPRPHRVHPGDILKNHPVDLYGCTVCHQGQGAATNFFDAKADDVAWDYPLLSKELTQSSCAACHDVSKLNAIAPQQVGLLTEGLRLYQEKSCASCHKIGGRGGALGPALDNEGAKTKHQLILTNLKPPHTTWNWHLAHFRDPAGIVAASQMKNPTVTDHEALALTVYMLSLRTRDVPESYLAPDKIEQKARALHPQALSGEQVFRQNCFACHGGGTYGRWDKIFKRFIPAIRGPSLQTTADRAYLEANIAKGRPGTQMPAWELQAGGLQPEEISALAAFLLAAAPGHADAALARTNLASAHLARGDAQRGEKLFLRHCAGCHGVAGHGGVAPELDNPTFQQAASDDFIVATIRNGRRNTAMPSFQPGAGNSAAPAVRGLTNGELSDLLAFVRSLSHGATKPQTSQARVAKTPGGAR
jgi:mono/diheme cytochrome c family protein